MLKSFATGRPVRLLGRHTICLYTYTVPWKVSGQGTGSQSSSDASSRAKVYRRSSTTTGAYLCKVTESQ